MKKIIIAALALSCGVAFAMPLSAICNGESQAALLVSTGRDMGRSPQEALREVKKVMPPNFQPGDYFYKTLINAVYFSPNLQNVPAEALSFAVFSECMHPRTPYQPIK